MKRYPKETRREPSRLWLVECRLRGHRTVKITGNNYTYVYCHDCSRTIYREDKRHDK